VQKQKRFFETQKESKETKVPKVSAFSVFNWHEIFYGFAQNLTWTSIKDQECSDAPFFSANNLDKNRNYIYYLVTLDFSPGTKGCPLCHLSSFPRLASLENPYPERDGANNTII
jgi:hypothetical protein